MPLPPGFSLTPPGAPAAAPSAGSVNLPPGFSLTPPAAAAPAEQPGAVSRFASNFAAALNPFPALKHYFLDVPLQQGQDIQNKLQSGDYFAALGTIVKGSTPGSSAVPDVVRAQAHQFVQAYKDLNDSKQMPSLPDRLLSATGHVMAGSLPLVGPAAAEAGEQIGSGDVAGGLGKGAGLVASIVVPEAIKAGAPKAAAAVDAVRNNRADAFDASADRNIGTALNPTTKVNKALVENKLAEGMRDRGIVATSREDLQAKAQAGIEKYGQQIDDVFDKHADLGTALSPKPIIAALEKEKQNYIVSGVTINKPFVNTLSDLQDQIQAVSDANGGSIPVADLRSIRQIHDETIAKSKGGFALPPDATSQIDALKTYTNSIRSSFADNLPELVEPNQEFSFYKDLAKVNGDTMLRKVGQRAPLTQKIGAMIGSGVGGALGHAVAGELGTGVGVSAGAALGSKLGAFKTSTLWNTLAASVKTRIADMLRTGDDAGAVALAKRNGIVPTAAPATDAAAETEAQSGDTNAGNVGSGEAPQGAGIRTADGSAAQVEGAGARTAIKVPGKAGRGYGAQYQLQELDSLNASHNGLTFAPNAEFRLLNDRNYANAVNQGKVVNAATPAEFDPAYHVTDNPDATNGPIITDAKGHVIGGNGRTMILQRVYNSNPKGAAAYRDLLEKKAPNFGLDPEQVRSMKQPVLTRVVDESEFGPNYTKQDAVTDFNKKGTAELTPAERAIADSRRVSTPVLDEIASRLDAQGPKATIADALDGKDGIEVLNSLIKDGVVSPQERGAFADQNALTKAGRERVAQLVVGRFFRDPAQIDRIAPAVRAKIERMAAPLAQVEAKAAWNLTPHVQQAVDIVEAAKAAGIKSIQDFIDQDGLFGKDKYAPEAVAIAKALQTSKSADVVAAARQYAQDATYAEKGDSLLGATPTPESSFKDSFGALKSGAAAEGEAALAQAKKKLNSQNALRSETARPYEAPRLTGNRDEPYVLDGSDVDHLQRARFERIPLSREDAENAVAHTANLSGFEYINRMTAQPADSVFNELHGHHISPDQLRTMLENLAIDEQALRGAPAPALGELTQAAREAQAGGKSLIIVKDHASFQDAARAAALNEELNHAAQRAATGPLDKHLGGGAKPFLGGPLGRSAATHLEQNAGYNFRSPGEAAAEVGVRLMQPEGYRELGLSRDQARALASEYMQRLDKEYGHARVAQISARIFDAFR